MTLEVRGLCVGYGDIAVVSDVSLSVNEGEAVCLVGPNGAGKSTTVRGIIGLNRPTSGSIVWNGHDLTTRSASVRAHSGIALVPEGRHVFPQLTVQQNLQVAARVVRGRKSAPTDRLAAAYERFPELAGRCRQHAGLLSGGEQQMLAIARALVQEPQLLIIDELSLGLAPIVVERVAHAVRQLVLEGLAVLLIEQHAALAVEICSRGYLMTGGTVQFGGPVSAMQGEGAFQDLYFGGREGHG